MWDRAYGNNLYVLFFLPFWKKWLKNYWHFVTGKTAKSILISVGVRLTAFNLKQIANLTCTDELDLYSIGEKKSGTVLLYSRCGHQYELSGRHDLQQSVSDTVLCSRPEVRRKASDSGTLHYGWMAKRSIAGWLWQDSGNHAFQRDFLQYHHPEHCTDESGSLVIIMIIRILDREKYWYMNRLFGYCEKLWFMKTKCKSKTVWQNFIW